MGLIELVFVLCRILFLIGNLYIKGFVVVSILYFFFLLISIFLVLVGRVFCVKGVVFIL